MILGYRKQNSEISKSSVKSLTNSEGIIMLVEWENKSTLWQVTDYTSIPPMRQLCLHFKMKQEARWYEMADQAEVDE